VIDDYPSCEETHVTLFLYHDSADPVSVSSALRAELCFDVYFHGACEGVRQAKQINATHPGT
jgi:hypothetical protein